MWRKSTHQSPQIDQENYCFKDEISTFETCTEQGSKERPDKPHPIYSIVNGQTSWSEYIPSGQGVQTLQEIKL